MKYLNPEKLAQIIEAHMKANQEAGKVGAAGICVLQEGKILYKNYFGKISYGQENAACPDDGTLFRLASMTKPITAAAVLIQTERGKLSLDMPVAELLPEYAELYLGKLGENKEIVRLEKAKTQLTLRHLLNHTNGVGSTPLGEEEFNRMKEEERRDLASVAAYFSKQPLSFEPGSAQAYSPFAAFDIAARMVELSSGQSFDRFVKENIFAPCGMSNTSFTPHEIAFDRLVAMHDRSSKGKSIDRFMKPGCIFSDFPVTWFCAGAGLASTLPDYCKFAQMLCNGGIAPNGNRVLKENAVTAMRTPSVPVEIMPLTERWGLGVRVVTEKYHLPIGSYGWSGAYGTHFFIEPENRITAVFLKNSFYDMNGASNKISIRFERDVFSAWE